MYSNEKANKELKSILSQFKDAYRMACDASHKAYVSSLPTGAQIPRDDVIYGENYKAEFDSMCAGFRKKAHEIMDERLSELREKATEAPSTEAVNSITLLSMRKDIPEKEFENLLVRYGDNAQAWKTIVSIANAHGIHSFTTPDIDDKIADVESLDKSLDKVLSLKNAIDGYANDGFLAMVGMDIDNVFPTEG